MVLEKNPRKNGNLRRKTRLERKHRYGSKENVNRWLLRIQDAALSRGRKCE